jgi:CRP/FNR family transcriptional regulator, cyclic AMP receptor protein
LRMSQAFCRACPITEVRVRTKTENNSLDRPDLKAILRNHSPYCEWSDGSIASIGKLAQRVEYRKGDLIDMNSHNGATVFLIARGVFELVITLANGRDQCLGYAHPGSMMGLGDAFTPCLTRNSQEYLADTDASVWHIPSAGFKEVMWRDEAMIRSVLSGLASRMGMMVESSVSSSLLSASARVANCLLGAAESHERTGLWISRTLGDYSMTQSQLVRMLGLSRQSVGTVLREFSGEGLIRTARQKIELLSPDGLREFVKGSAVTTVD